MSRSQQRKLCKRSRELADGEIHDRYWSYLGTSLRPSLTGSWCDRHSYRITGRAFRRGGGREIGVKGGVTCRVEWQVHRSIRELGLKHWGVGAYRRHFSASAPHFFAHVLSRQQDFSIFFSTTHSGTLSPR